MCLRTPRNAQAIAKGWRAAVHALDPDRFQIEAIVAPELDQKIDIVDQENGCAYEFKVSGKNAWAEFYKDVVKVIIWNQRRKKRLSSLVFITEEKWGRPFLDALCHAHTLNISQHSVSMYPWNMSAMSNEKPG